MDWSTFLATFGLVFIAELGDKTQLAVVTQTCKFRRPWAVFFGASLALLVVTALGALGGQVLASFLPEQVLRVVAALAFIVMGLVVGREAFKAGRFNQGQVECASPDEVDVDCKPERGWDWRAFGATFGLLFVAELGDKTQLAVLSLVGRHGNPWTVFLGGSLALTAVTALGVIGGESLCRIIPERVLLWVSAAAFLLMGILMGVGVL